MYKYVLFILCIIIAGCSSPTVAPEHQYCDSVKDCRIIQFDCGDCDCGQAVASEHYTEYYDIKQKRCRWVPMKAMCDIYCEQKLSCVEGKCIYE